MRVVVDYGAVSRPSAIAAAGQRKTEPVVVIRHGAADRGLNADRSGAGENVAQNTGRPESAYVTSDEARLLDARVRGHEATHRRVLGPYAASGIQLTTRRGADGESIAVGGRIKADLAPVPGDPRATLRKANTVRRAALAVGSPSVADMRIAAEAYRLARDASEAIEHERVNTSA